MYMAPIRTRDLDDGRRGRSVGVGIKFLFAFTVSFGVFAGLAYAFLLGQGPHDYHVQAAVQPDAGPHMASTRAKIQTASDHRAGAGWTRPAGVTPGKSVEIAAAPPKPRVRQTSPSAMNRIAPGSGGPTKANTKAPSKKAGTKNVTKAGTKAAGAAPRALARRAVKRKHARRHTARAGRTQASRNKASRRRATSPARKQVAQMSTADMIGPYRVQVGSFRTAEAAQDRWFALQRRHKDLLGAYIMVIEKVNLGNRGVVYRLQAGPLKTRGAVRKMCRDLGKRRIGCSLVDG